MLDYSKSSLHSNQIMAGLTNRGPPRDALPHLGISRDQTRDSTPYSTVYPGRDARHGIILHKGPVSKTSRVLSALIHTQTTGFTFQVCNKNI